jgi:alpha 1,3-glucosidase
LAFDSTSPRPTSANPQASTAKGITRRSGGRERPFVLSRAFFVGSQKYGAIWTGDNNAEWGHLEFSVPMLLSIGVAGLPFCGADMGGFFGNPEVELMVRWYQVGAYQPFMRAHAHLDSKRREPYLFDEEPRNAVRSAVRARYELLPYWYTLNYEAMTTGTPLMRPLWVEFPQETAHYKEQANFLAGHALLVAPVLQQGQTAVDVHFPGSGNWYDVYSGELFRGPARKNLKAPLDTIRVFQRGGTIVPRKLRVRRSSSLMLRDPFTLVVALDENDSARGQLYLDDYHTLDYTQGRFALRQFEISPQGEGKSKELIFTSSNAAKGKEHKTQEWVERVRIMGVGAFPREVLVTVGKGRRGLTVFILCKACLVSSHPLSLVSPVSLLSPNAFCCSLCSLVWRPPTTLGMPQSSSSPTTHPKRHVGREPAFCKFLTGGK